ncbi:hypothetical protein [Mucilaginibacter phyllosphaerae]
MFKYFQSVHRTILLTLLTVVSILGILVIIKPAAIFPDASWGFQVLRSMQMGSSFNTLVKPSSWDISKNSVEFLSWWSPGQYLVPYFFKALLGINTGHAASVTTAVCQILGLVGFYKFFKKAGFTPLISALSLVVIVLQQAFFLPYIFHIGGETLFFAFAGWFLYGCLTFNKANWHLALFILLSGWIGFICKSSFIWVYAACLFYIWIRLCYPSLSIKNWLIKGLWIGIPAIISVGVIWWQYLSKGANPSSASSGLDFSWQTFTFPIASPLLAGFSADDLVNGFIFHNDIPVLSPGLVMPVLILLAILSILLIYFICKTVKDDNYKLILLIIYGVSILFFGSAFMRKLDISYEARHFRIVGLLVIPGTLYLFSQFKMVYRAGLGLAILVIAFFSIKFYVIGQKGLYKFTAYGTSGIGQQFIDQQSLDYVKLLDDRHKDAIFVFFSPDLGLEIQHNRIITLDALNKDININFDDYLHKGHAGPLYIIMPSYYIGIRANVILKSFPGYKGFSLKELSDEYVLYFATEAR